LYDSLGHSLGQLALASRAPYRRLHALVNTLLPLGASVVVWFVADFGRTLARYRHGESLVWRDAGALLATMNLVAEALGMNCCALGATGDPWVSRMLQAGTTVRGVGGCLIGGRVG
jgi:hypothetical protein